MKKALLILGVLATAALLLGCDDNNPVYPDKIPAAPQGVYSVTGNNAVDIVWNGVYERDIDYYVVYRSFNANDGYNEIGTVNAAANPDLDLITYSFTDNNLVNGTTYYFAVSAVDEAGQESPLSAETVYDTPRPDGYVTVYSVLANSAYSGLDLKANPRVTWSGDTAADIYVDTMWGAFYVSVTNGQTDIQDMGYTTNFDEIGYAPNGGWSEVGYMELIIGHTYLIWTKDDHYAKLRVQNMNMNDGYVIFQWAYQTDPGNPELAPAMPGTEKPIHGDDYLRKTPQVATESM